MADSFDPTLDRAKARVGTTLREKWHLDVLLGVGGMAAVYAATHRNGKRAAVKVLHPMLSLDANVRGRFIREGHVANRVGHPGAVSVIDDDTAEDGSTFLVMDLLDGETLAERVERFGGRLDPAEVLSVMDQLLDVLVAAHGQGIIHRDIKPENIFVTRSGQVKVLDFGIARLRELSTASTATQQGSMMGTPAYMPPEQARGLWDQVDARTDLWAVGATAFTLLAGRLVHAARTMNEQLLAAMTAHAQPMAEALPGLPTQVNEVVDRALMFDKHDRWENARAMQGAVRVAYQALAGTSIADAPRLVVPTMPTLDTAPTIRLSPDIAASATGDALVTGQTGVDVSKAARPGKGLVVGILGAATVVVAGTAIGAYAFLADSSSGDDGDQRVRSGASTRGTAGCRTRRQGRRARNVRARRRDR